MPKRGKKYQEAAKLIDRQNLYEIEEAVDLAVSVDIDAEWLRFRKNKADSCTGKRYRGRQW